MAKLEKGNGFDLGESTEKLTDNGKSGSYGSDPEANGSAITGEIHVDKYGFTGGAQQYSGDL